MDEDLANWRYSIIGLSARVLARVPPDADRTLISAPRRM